MNGRSASDQNEDADRGERTRRLRRVGVVLSLVVAIAPHDCPRVASITAQEPPLIRLPFFPGEPPDEVDWVLQRQRTQAARRISIRTACLLHARIIETVVPTMPANTVLFYEGRLGVDDWNRANEERDRGRHYSGDCDHWHVCAESNSIFGFWVSLERTKESVAKVRIEESDLFLNVDFITDNQGLDEKLPELGGRSVRAVLALAEKSAVGERPAAGGAEAAERRTSVSYSPSGPDPKFAKAMADEAGRITLYEASTIQWRFAAAAITELPKKTSLVYSGNLRYNRRKRHPSVGPPDPTEAVHWEVRSGSRTVFTFWASVEQTSQSVNLLRIEDCDLFLNVDYIDGDKGLDDKLPLLEGRSIRTVINFAVQEPIIDQQGIMRFKWW